eukprot:3174085-Rhodomonas_salina.2
MRCDRDAPVSDQCQSQITAAPAKLGGASKAAVAPVMSSDSRVARILRTRAGAGGPGALRANGRNTAGVSVWQEGRRSRL